MLLLCTILMMASISLVEGRTEAAGTTIDAAKLKSISRLYFPMRDNKNQLYTLYLFANDETNWKATEDDVWAGVSLGDVIYSGKYQAALVKNGKKTGQVQAVNLHFMLFNATRNESFRLPGDGKNRPDLVFLSQAETTDVNSINGFVITDGVLHSLNFSREDGSHPRKEAFVAPKDAMRGLSDERIQTRIYDNSSGKYYFNTYKVNLKGLKLQHIDSLYHSAQSWPKTQGARAFLDSLKQSAFKHVLPGNPKVKIGMTEKQVRAIMGQPKEKENDEWAGYFGYGKSWIGFDSYIMDGKLEDAQSRVVELTSHLGDDQFIRAEQIREWLGKPTEEIDNSEGGESGYTLLYRWKNALITFYYEDEYHPITAFTIY